MTRRRAIKIACGVVVAIVAVAALLPVTVATRSPKTCTLCRAERMDRTFFVLLMADLPRHRVYRLVSHTPSRAPARVGTPHLHSWLLDLRHYDVFRLWPTPPHLRHPAGYAPRVCRACRYQHACRFFRRHHLDQSRLAASGCSVGLGQDIGEQMTTRPPK